MITRLHPSLRGFLVLWLGLGVALVGISSPLRAEAAAGWGAPSLIDSTAPETIDTVSCPSSGFCMAVDGVGNALRYNGTSWSAAVSIDGTGDLSSVSCPSSNFCIAVDYGGNAIRYNGTSWSAPASIDGTSPLFAVSCSSSSFCMAVDSSGNALHYNGASWSAPVSIDASVDFLGFVVSCPSSSFCLAVDDSGNAVRYDGTSWSAPVSINGTSGLSSVSCPSSSFCIAVDYGGNALRYDGTSWSAPVSINGTSGLSTVSCPSSSFCIAVDYGGNALHYNGTSWSAPVSINGTVGQSSVSCPTSSFCMVVDGSGNALSYDGTSWSQPSEIDLGPNLLSSVSCPSSSFCMALDSTSGNALRYNGTSWSAPVSIDATTYSSNFLLSCPSTTFCMAVDYAGNALRYDGTSWSAPVSIEASGMGGPTSVSCPSSSFCMAVDWSGNALRYNGTSWSAPVSIDASFLGPTSVSCLSSSFCMAVDDSGNAFRYNGTSWSGPGSIDGTTGLSSVSCPSSSFCMAVDSGGNALRYNGTSWSAAVGIDDTLYLQAISCPSSNFCMAVDFSGNALEYNGTSWSGPVGIDGSNGVKSVSCPSISFCMAVDDNGNAVSYIGIPAPTVTGVSPSQGSSLGGATITISGTDLAGATAVHFGTHLGSSLSVVSTSSLTVTSPPGTGTVGVTVTTPSGTSGLTPADEYRYVGLPVISAVTPSAGPMSGGQVVSVTGSNFAPGMTLSIGGASVTPSSITATSFSFTTPAHATGYVQVQVTNAAGASALTTAAGYVYSGLGSYVPLTPFRILDTRSGLCGVHTCPALGAGQTLTLQVTGYTDARTGESVPANATTVVLNTLAVNGSSSSLLTMYPSGTGRPLASNLNFSAYLNTANLVTVALGQNGASDTQREVNIFNALGSVNVVVDVEGYFAPQSASNPAGEFHAIAPLRICDTRVGQPANGCNEGRSTDNKLGQGQVFKVNVTGLPSGVSGSPASIPADGTGGAAVLNLTAVAGSQATFLSVFPTQSNGTCATGQPGSSTINVAAGAVQANRVIVPLGPSHLGGANTDVCVYNAVGAINVLMDASGWFGSTSGSPATGAQYQAIGPTRICDTRSGSGTECSAHQLTSSGTLLVAVAGVGGIPGNGPVAIIANLTAVSGTGGTYLTAYPADVSPRPNASDVNVNAGATLPNLVVVGLASGGHAGDLNLFNSMGSINAVLDVDGWFQ